MRLISIDSLVGPGVPGLMFEAGEDEKDKLKKGSVARRAAEAEAASTAKQKEKVRKKRRSAEKKRRKESDRRAKEARKDQEKQDAKRKKRATKARKSNQERGQSVATKRKKRIKKLSREVGGRFKPGSAAFTKDGRKKVDQVPSQLAHCMLAVRYKRKKSAKAAWNICRWSLTKHGYLKKPYKEKGKIPDATRQTRKGVRRTMQHSQEKHPLGGGVKGTPERKYDKFSRMFKSIEKDV